MSRNELRLSGYLGQDAKEIRTENSKFTALNLAIPRYQKNKESGEWEELKPQWVEVLAFDGVATRKANFLKKGDRIEVDGSLRTVTKEIDGKNIPFLRVVAGKIEKFAKIEDPIHTMGPDFNSEELPDWDSGQTPF